jgi:hypothetical protein
MVQILNQAVPQQVVWKPAVYREVNVGSLVMRGELYRLVVPIAIRRDGSDLVVVEPVWAQCRATLGRHCVVYFPADVEAVVYLKEFYDFWREVEVRCDCGDMEFCRILERCANKLWKPRRRPRSPEEVAAELPLCVNS